ncbi:hypothetical protein [Bacillus sp. B15-48]|uniref:hypothetical protein n=1 Tax=Bacillus sp. B15-48 TaxID=1548601 RepID=UPI0019400784|nr:hypothetical protein [Bacillus sp. B15-48]MBM4762728.1 hypothetical protein [Bacillus sp. B15-48]
MDKEKPVELENVIIYSDIGLGGRCPVCGGLNSINNEKCTDCGQLLRKKRVKEAIICTEK